MANIFEFPIQRFNEERLPGTRGLARLARLPQKEEPLSVKKFEEESFDLMSSDWFEPMYLMNPKAGTVQDIYAEVAARGECMSINPTQVWFQNQTLTNSYVQDVNVWSEETLKDMTGISDYARRAGLIGFKRARSWRDSVADWHKGAPPHEGEWLVRRSGDYHDGLRYEYTNAQWTSKFNLGDPLHKGNQPGGKNALEWFGHAPDSEGWIKWDKPAEEMSWEKVSPVFGLGRRSVEVMWSGSSFSEIYWADKISGFHSGSILAYRLV